MSPRPWKRLRSEPPLDFEILRVRQDWVENPRDGSEHPRVILEAPDWVNIIPVTRQADLVLVRQYRFGVGQPGLEIPGGMVDDGETPEQAAIRELEEETGFRPGRVVRLGQVHPNPALQGNTCHHYLALDCEAVHRGRPDPTEELEVVLHPLSAMRELVVNGQVTHALVLSAFLFYELASPSQKTGRSEQG